MLRIIVRTDDAGMACHVGGAVLSTFKTFLVDLPEIEGLICSRDTYSHTQVVGVEVISAALTPPAKEPSA